MVAGRAATWAASSDWTSLAVLSTFGVLMTPLFRAAL